MGMTVSRNRMQVVEGACLSILGFRKKLDEKFGEGWLCKWRINGDVPEEAVKPYNKVIIDTCKERISDYILLKMDTEENRQDKTTTLSMNFSNLYESIEKKIGKYVMRDLRQNKATCESISLYNEELKEFFQLKMKEYTII